MFKKSDILPLILAFVTTVLIVILGFSWLAKSKIGGFGSFAQDSDSLRQDKNPRVPDAQATTEDTVKSNVTGSQSTASGKSRFIMPVLVPQGISVTINGSAELNQINRALRKSFHQQYPGTIITTYDDGATVGIDLLYAREIDLAALDRPLSQAEKAAGLMEIGIYQSQLENNSGDSQMYYVYQEPLSPDTEIFLSYVLSIKGQQAINKL